jgi:hypothetical protein
MRAWESRSIEEANLLNPAFLSVLLVECIKGYTSEEKEQAPYVLPFLVLPLVLHKKTRLALPGTTRTIFASWISKKEGTLAKAGYPERALSLKPYIKEALLFSLANGLIQVDGKGGLQVLMTNSKRKGTGAERTEEVEDCIMRSSFCGRWFARVGKVETVMTFLGVRP